MITIKAGEQFHRGNMLDFYKQLSDGVKEYPKSDLCLDLSDVVYMDSGSFRVVFDFMPKLTKLIPPNSPIVISMYNEWLDSKKGLSKGLR